MFDWKTSFRRALRGMREDQKMHIVSISSLTIAFLSLGIALLLIANLGRVAGAWGQGARMSVFLRDNANEVRVRELENVLRSSNHVEAVAFVSRESAREAFLRGRSDRTLEGLSASYFPAAIEVRLARTVRAPELRVLGERIRSFEAVEDVETYHTWFARLENLLLTGRSAAVGLGILVLLCVCFVVANTVRLSLLARKDEIEILRLCGADQAFVRGPFLLEGAIQGALGATLSIVLLLLGYSAVRERALALFHGVTQLPFGFVPFTWLVSIVVLGAVMGGAGSLLSLRKHLSI